MTISVFGREVFTIETERQRKPDEDGPVVDSRHNGLFERAEFGFSTEDRRHCGECG